jgi:PelA/Pel-15E family pectate lyase
MPIKRKLNIKNQNSNFLNFSFLILLFLLSGLSFGGYNEKPDDWYCSAEARQIADNILSWQSPQGSWPKNVNTERNPYTGDPNKLEGTFDNGVTTPQMRFLARSFRATGDRRLEQAFLKGLDHILKAQYLTGGWPQFYPPTTGYPRHITFNDGAMIRLMYLLRDIAESSDYEFVDADRRQAATKAFDRGIDCILKCQIRVNPVRENAVERTFNQRSFSNGVNGKLTVWCAQHDEVDYGPRAGRTYELPSLSGSESVAILGILMSLDKPSPQIIEAIHAGVEWFESAKITGIRQKWIDGDKVIVKDANAPPLWARFCEIETNRPIFSGRDGVKKYDMAEIEAERRNHYGWYGNWGQLVADRYAKWRSTMDETRVTSDDGRGTSSIVLVPADLRCEYAVNPLGVDVPQPRLFWKLESTIRGQRQSAYQILVASSSEILTKDKGDLWNTKKVRSDKTTHILYKGRALKSSQQAFWKVRVWDKDGKASSWSQTASWIMGLLKVADWQAKWITANRSDKDPLPNFGKSIRLSEPVKQAIIHICGLGHYELSINGRRVGDYQMDPGWTNYRKTCLYSSYDVTSMLEPGDNCIAVMLGNGMYNVPGGRYTKFKGTFGPPKLICQIHVTFVDGSTAVIASDETWKYALGPIVFSCIFGGEDYDARREQAADLIGGWDRPDFDDKEWSEAVVCEGPGGNLAAQYAPPIKVADYLPAVAIQRLEDGQYEVDCGINLSARPLIKVKGPTGSQVVVKCAEKRGEPWMKNGGHIYTYTLKGQGEEVFRPRFTYFSFQYLYISGVDRPGDINNVEQRVVLLEAGSEFLTSSAALVGGFKCSNALFNDIDAMIERSVRSNLQSVVTDCPHREKLGWLEVPHLMGPSILYHHDVYNLYRKICRDMTESQLESGLVPNIAPEYMRFEGAFFESPEWGSACVQVPNLLFKWYGDRTTEEQQYETMKRYTLYLASSRNQDGLVKPGLGDWYDWTPQKGHVGASQLTPKELPATAFLYDNARILSSVARRLGKKADVAEFESIARGVRQDFIKAYYKPAEHSVATGSQAALATALYFGIVPEEDRQIVLANLVTELEKTQYRQSTGEVCFRMLVQALAEGGRSDVVYRMINRTDAPGYGNMLKLGFKTLSERWDKPGSSMNHCMFGHIQEWFQSSIVGIRQSPDSVGFKRLILRPEPVGDLTSASGHLNSIHGRIESKWRIDPVREHADDPNITQRLFSNGVNGRFYWHVTIPPNTTAEVHVPVDSTSSPQATDSDKVIESGTLAEKSRGVKFLRRENGRMIYKIGSGEYEFQSRF